MSNLEITLGCDPEVFLQDESGRFVSAAGLFPGTKEKPHKVNKGAIQVDGLALEFNIDPAKTAEEFDENIQTVLDQMNAMVAEKKLKIVFSPVAKFDKTYFDKEVPVESKILGCDPDFESPTGAITIPKTDITNQPIRTAAGHIHVGWTKDEDAMSPAHFEDARFIAEHFRVKAQYLHKTPDELERLKYYGGNGAFRPKSYGVELRQYSNLWVQTSAARKKMFNDIKNSVVALYKGN